MGASYQGIAAFNTTTGKRTWFDNVDVADPPTIANGVVYVDAEEGLSLIMLNSSTGAQSAASRRRPARMWVPRFRWTGTCT